MRNFTTRTYERAARKLLSEADRQAMEDREDLRPEDKKALSRLVAAIKEEESRR